MTLGLYTERDSSIHRLTPAVKLLALLVLSVAVFVLRDWRLVLGLGLGVVGLYAAARLDARTLWVQLRGAVWMLLFFFVVQLLTSGLDLAVLTVLRFAVMILAAALVTLTTRVSAMLDALERALQPLARFGVQPARVSLAFSLTIRFIPVIAQVLEDVREAQKARGLEGNLLALTIPLIVRTLKMADDVADAIDARSWDG